ncbi:MAG: hypothetical protein M1826_007629 [Phylliscum demangeonii]|nr:MAG: hypothetical protein M1826_007629 [Phylliscum demangeonii]
MPLSVTTANIKLTYPIYAADFDERDDGYLLAGGGGGEGRSGVGNKITLLDAHAPHELAQLAERELSRDEDSVTSLAVANRIGPGSALVLAGVNSSTAAQQAGTNEHLRAFTVTYPTLDKPDPPREKPTMDAVLKETSSGSAAAIEERSRRSLFSTSSAIRKETYQRLLRISPAPDGGDDARLAALATGLAPDGEVVLVDAGTGTVHDRVRGRFRLKKGEEAADVDMIACSDDDAHHVAYCTDYDVWTCKVPRGSSAAQPISEQDARCAYSIPHADVFSSGKRRATLRALRFLTPSLLLLLANLPGRSGVELLVLQHHEKDGGGAIERRKRLHRSMKAAVGLDVCRLPARADRSTQCVIAAAGQDVSIELLTLTVHPSTGIGRFEHYATYRDVHPLQMTKISFSKRPTGEGARLDLESHLKLASVSMGNTVVVQTFPLTRTSPGPDRVGEYKLEAPPRRVAIKLSIVSIALAVLIALLSRWLLASGSVQAGPDVVRHVSTVDAAPSSSPAPYATVSALRLRDLLRGQAARVDGPARPVHVKIGADGLIASLAAGDDNNDDDEAKKRGRGWADLKEEEKDMWRQRLEQAGEWTVNEGEELLKGIVFGQIAAVVAHVVANA